MPSLQRMLEDQEVVAVITQPDKPAGRGLKLTPTPVAVAGRSAGAEVLMPARLDAEFIDRLRRLRPELLACASYGKILPAALLAMPGLSALNVHPSLLPKYRGATPIQAALRDGCTQTGVTIFWMAQRMDAGDIALPRAIPIDPADDYGTLHDKLAQAGAVLLSQAAARLSEGQLSRTPQRDEEATYCRPLLKDDLRLRFDVPAQRVVDQVRSLAPKPGAWMLFEGKRLKVLRAEEVEPAAAASSNAGRADSPAPGVVTAFEAAGPVIACAPGAIRLLRVVPEGKPGMSGAQFARGQ